MKPKPTGVTKGRAAIKALQDLGYTIDQIRPVIPKLTGVSLTRIADQVGMSVAPGPEITATILYHKGYPRAHIQAVLRHKNLRTTQIYLQSLGLEQVRGTLEEGLNGPAEIIDINQARQKNASQAVP